MQLITVSSFQQRVLLGMAIVLVAGGFIVVSLWHLLIEIQISLYGKEAYATVVKVETFEQDNGDRSWEEDRINYTFRIPEGYFFSGVNVANQSQTERLIGLPNVSGAYNSAIVEYHPRNPEWHRLKGWGYDGYGPPGGMVNLAFRVLLNIVVIGFALAYAYGLFTRDGKS